VLAELTNIYPRLPPVSPTGLVIDKNTDGSDIVDLLPANTGRMNTLSRLSFYRFGKSPTMWSFCSFMHSESQARSAYRKH